MVSTRYALAVVSAVISASYAISPTPFAKDIQNHVIYRGLKSSRNVEHFLNIPYGQDTSGSKRFTNPEPYIFPQGTKEYDASVPGPICPQPVNPVFKFMSPAVNQSEDCLKLRVSRPMGVKAGDKLPVMVFIHGGGNFNGHVNEKTYDPEGLIHQSMENGFPVIYAAMNYRLSIFGFAVSEALREKNSLNVALKDQRLALQWIRSNIACFGGDPDRITIFGQNTGALSVAHQVLAYGGTKAVPFHSAIMESRTLEPTSASNITRESFDGVASMSGCSINGTFHSEATIDCLRALPFATLMNITIAQHDSTADQNDGDTYLPTIDGDFLPQLGSELLRKGSFPKMPVMIGWTEDDASMFTRPTIKTPADTLDFLYTDLLGGVTNSTLTDLLSLYPLSEFSSKAQAHSGVLTAEFYRASQIFRDIFLVCPPILFGHAMARKYQLEHVTPPVYYYHQNQTVLSDYLAAEFGSGSDSGLGVVYTSELAYVFGNFSNYNSTGDIHPTGKDLELLKRQSRSWSSFASEARPSLDERGHSTLEGWKPAYGIKSSMMDASVFVVGGPEEGLSSIHGGTTTGLESQRLKDRCEFLNRDDVIAQLRY
ncbi:hypothetical protein PM082_007078 [Marasmius tenuissimus]|nr:hypothetical protein PM082_007078 [Marasmius tenuissimus]